MNTKRCRKCGSTDFVMLKEARKRSRCRTCHNNYARARADERREYMRGLVAKNPNYHRRYQLKARYGVTLERYEAMRSAQDGVCAICRNPEVRKSKGGKIAPLVVDHDHQDGRVRGLLCHACNVALAIVERPDWLVKARGYLDASLSCIGLQEASSS